MTFLEHRRLSDRAYFESIMHGRSHTDAIRLSGLHRGSFYRIVKRLGVPTKPPNPGNGAWQGIARHDSDATRV
jgi:hypothetical protein